MLAIRLQRLGRKAFPVYRLAVQESRRHPSSGRVVAYVGTFNPHTKATTVDAEKVSFYLKNGAQPTPRVVRILTNEKVELPVWVKQLRTDKQSATRKPEKLRKHQPVSEETTPEPAKENPETTKTENAEEPVKEA
jgi:small subunit ribosomal protein S16